MAPGGTGGTTTTRVDEDADDAVLQEKAEMLRTVLMNLGTWPDFGIDWALAHTAKGETGIKELVTEVVNDRMGYHGLRDAPAAIKARIVSIILDTPLPSGERFATALCEVAKTVEATRTREPLLKRWYKKANLMYAMATAARNKKGSNDFYVAYSAHRSRRPRERSSEHACVCVCDARE
jgi:hypothetical protein